MKNTFKTIQRLYQMQTNKNNDGVKLNQIFVYTMSNFELKRINTTHFNLFPMILSLCCTYLHVFLHAL